MGLQRMGALMGGNATEQSFMDYLTQVDDVLAAGGHATSTQDELEEISEDHGAGRSIVEAVRGLLVLRQKEKT